jgi:hypothetical protein
MAKKAKAATEIDDIFAKKPSAASKPPPRPAPAPSADLDDAVKSKKRKRKRPALEVVDAVETVLDPSQASAPTEKPKHSVATTEADEVFMDSRGTTRASCPALAALLDAQSSLGRRTDDGLPIYDAKELRIGEGGGALRLAVRLTACSNQLAQIPSNVPSIAHVVGATLACCTVPADLSSRFLRRDRCMPPAARRSRPPCILVPPSDSVDDGPARQWRRHPSRQPFTLMSSRSLRPCPALARLLAFHMLVGLP